MNENLIIQNQDRLKELGFKKYRISQGVIKHYREDFHGNSDITYDEAVYKLGRNIACGQYINKDYKGIIKYGYGCMKITVANNCIVSVKSTKPIRYRIDFEKKAELDSLLGFNMVQEVKQDIKEARTGLLHRVMNFKNKIMGIQV